MCRLSPLFIALVFFSAGCSASTPAATPVLAYSATRPSTPTARPAATVTPWPLTDTPGSVSIALPSGTPAREWKGIAIMPGALAGSGDNQGYSFTTAASAADIQQYYDRQLRALGAAPLAVGQGTQPASVLMIYLKDGSPISVSIFPQGSLFLVLLVK